MTRAPKRFHVPLLICIGIAAAGATYDAAWAQAPRSGAPSAEGGARQSASSASNALQQVDYAIVAAGRIAIKLTFRNEIRERPPAIAGYHPAANLVLDFADAASELPAERVEIGHRDARNIQVLTGGGRTRVVINLNRPLSYEVAVAGREVLVTLQRHPDPGAAR